MNKKPQSTLRVLLVDDNEQDSNAIRQALSKDDTKFKVTHCSTVEEALKYIHSDEPRYDIIVSDYKLPDKSGLDFYNELRTKNTRVPFALISDSGSERIAVEALKSGVDDYIIKDSSQEYLKHLSQSIFNVTQKQTDNFMNFKLNGSLPEREKQYQMLMENASDIIWITDMDFKITYMSPSVEQHRGFTVKEALRLNMEETLTPESLEIARKGIEEELALENKMESPSARTVELELYCKDGSTIWTETKLTLIRDQEGKPIGMMGIARNITERKKAENELLRVKTELKEKVRERTAELTKINLKLNQEIEERKKAMCDLEAARETSENIIDSANALIMAGDIKGQLTIFNEAYENLTGYKKDEVLGKPFTILVPKEDRRKHSKTFKGVFEGKQLKNYEMTIVTKEGDKRTTLFNSTVIRDLDLKPVVIGIGYDITEQKHIEETRVKAVTDMEGIIDSMVDGLVLLDMNGKIIKINPALEKMCGVEKNELVDKDAVDFLSNMIKPEEIEKITEIFKGGLDGKAVPITFTILSKDGSEIPVEVNASYLKDSNGNPSTIIGALRDITKRKEAEEKLRNSLEKLERSNKELEQFAYIASHDLQEPLRKIRSFTELLAEHNLDKFDEKAEKYMFYITSGAARMQGLINDLLTYSRISTRGKPFESINVESVVNEVIDNIQVIINESNPIITHDYLPIIKADRVQLIQVFQNLISNSIKFHKDEAPKVHISVKETDNEWTFSVQDNGIGIEAKYIDRIFVIFQRLHTNTEYPGTGIGLAVCKKIIERHRGRIWVESKPGNGSTFYFTIPKIITLHEESNEKMIEDKSAKKSTLDNKLRRRKKKRKEKKINDPN